MTKSSDPDLFTSFINNDKNISNAEKVMPERDVHTSLSEIQ